MRNQATDRDLRSGIVLVAFVAVQLVYLFIDIVVLSPPAPDAPIAEFRTLVVEHSDTIRWYGLIALASFFGLFLPGVAGLRRRLAPSGKGSDLIMASALLIMVSVILTATSVAVLGLVPAAELSDSVLRTLVMINTYSAFVVGNFASAIFLTAVSIAMLQSDRPPRWLARWGLVAAGLSLVGSLWLLNGDFNGPLFGVSILSRAMWLAWIIGTGIWLRRAVLPAPPTPATA